MLAAGAVGGDQARVAELGEVLGDGRLRHIEAGSELFDGMVGSGEEIEDGAAGGVGDGAEDGVGGMHK